MNRYFGRAWDAPIVTDAEQAPTPIGSACIICGEPIEQGDQGMLMPVIYTGENGQPRMHRLPEHRGCMLLGVVGHMAGTCFCNEGLGSIRERGLATLAWAEEGNA